MVYAQDYIKIHKNQKWPSRSFPSNGKEELCPSMSQPPKEEKQKVPLQRMHLRSICIKKV